MLTIHGLLYYDVSEKMHKNGVGTTFEKFEADHFTLFLDSTGFVVSILLVVRSFTWMNKAGTTLSKHYRFLISEDVTIRLQMFGLLLSIGYGLIITLSFFILTKLILVPLRSNCDKLIASEEMFRRSRYKSTTNWEQQHQTLERNTEKPWLLRKLIQLRGKGLMRDPLCPSDNITASSDLQEFEKDDSFAFIGYYFKKLMSMGYRRGLPLRKLRKRWDCGSSKAPGPDGYSFAFVKKYWGTIQKDLYDFVKLIPFVLCCCLMVANSSFFTLIPKIVSKFFEKLFFLLNGSPTSEFSIKRGLRQGDPLSPFLFILVMEGLHNAFEEAVGNGLITGVNIKNSTINVSHLFYADDVIITTDWNAKDMDNIIRVLHVFYLASGLKINIHKSNIYGIGVNKDEVLSMASNAGCIAGDIPFNYLGLPIGSNMKSIASWKTLVDRFHMRLSSWKANLLSIGGRLTLIKSVLGSLGIYYLSIFRAPESVLQDLERIRANFFWGGNKDKNKMAWVKWPIILNSFDKGGLNIGSLKAFNLALLQKWRWRLLSSPNALWVQVIKAYHGQEGGFDTNGCSFKGIWANIVGTSNFLHSKGIILSNTFRFKAGCGTRIRFWKDIWVGETPLFTRYNRLYHLDQDKDCLIIDRINNGQWSWNWSRTNLGVRNLAYLCDMLNEIGQLNIDVNEDTCTWSLGPNGTFTVKDARYRIDQNILPTLAHATTWDKSIPRKVNVFMWRLSLDRLPHRLNLSSRGMDIPAISCPSCNANVESANHVFFECDIATDMWKLVFRWCDIPLFQASSWDSFNDWIISWHASKEKKHRFYVITTSVLWWLWRYRNSVTFSSQPLRKSDLFDNVRFSSFSWLHNRDHMKLSWNDWLMYPLSITRNGNG
ncbi:RNA-directed DNA polymerase, eukaryota, reverse transcriptase zinc-binding domain protein [Tanacetum coccineum]